MRVDWFSEVDWDRVFVPDTPLLEIVVRGSLVYIAAFLMLRFVLKREAGSLGISDLIVVVFLADAAQNAMGDDYRSVPDGVLLMLVIIGWAYLMDFLSFHVAWFRAFARPPEYVLMEDGRMNRRNMRRELVSEQELLGKLREQGVEELSDVKRVTLESDGQLSVVTKEGK